MEQKGVVDIYLLINVCKCSPMSVCLWFIRRRASIQLQRRWLPLIRRSKQVSAKQRRSHSQWKSWQSVPRSNFLSTLNKSQFSKLFEYRQDKNLKLTISKMVNWFVSLLPSDKLVFVITPLCTLAGILVAPTAIVMITWAKAPYKGALPEPTARDSCGNHGSGCIALAAVLIKRPWRQQQFQKWQSQRRQNTSNPL